MSDTIQIQSFKSLFSQSARDEYINKLRGAFAAAPTFTLGTIISDLTGDALGDTLLSLTVAELRSVLTPPAADKPAKEKKVSTDVKIENWSDAAVKAAHAERVMAFLQAGQMGEGDFARGFTPVQLRAKCDGTEDQLRDTMKVLEESGKVAWTGKTKGKKYVVASLRAQAEKVAAEEVAAAEKEKAEKAAKAAAKAASGEAAPAKGKAAKAG